MNPYVYLMFAILSEVVATSALKLSDGFTKPLPSVIVVIAYGIAFYLVSLSVKALSLNLTYALWAGIGTALTVLVSVVLFKETVTPGRLVGIGLIIAGVFVLNFSGGAHAA